MNKLEKINLVCTILFSTFYITNLYICETTKGVVSDMNGIAAIFALVMMCFTAYKFIVSGNE